MKKLFALLKLYFLAFGDLNVILRGKDKKRRNRASLMVVLFLFVAVTMFAMSFSMFYGMGYVLAQLGAAEAMLILACAAASVTSLITTVAKAAPTLFAFSDYDLLMSLPVRENTLVLSRVLRLYGINLFFMGFVLVPAAAAYAILTPVTGLFYARFLLLMLFVPLMPIALASAVGTLFASVGALFRRSSLVMLVLTTAFFLGIMALSFMTPQIMENIQSISTQIVESTARLYPPARWFAFGAAGELESFLLYTAVNVAVFGAFVLVVAKNFKRLNTTLRSKAASRKKAKQQSLKSPLKALYQKEIKRYFASPLYVLNTAFGAILLLAAAVALFLTGEQKLGEILNMPFLPALLKTAGPFAMSFFVSMSATTPASVSIEGKSLWVLKALPVSTRTVFQAKMLVSLTVMLPAIAIASTLVNIFLKADVLTAVLMYAIPAVYAVFMARLGLYANLLFPKLDWRSETEVIKQGAPVLVAMLCGMGASILPILLMSGLKSESIGLASVLVLCVMLLLTLLLGYLLRTDGTKRFSRL